MGIGLGFLSLPNDAFILNEGSADCDANGANDELVSPTILMQMASLERVIGPVRLVADFGFGLPTYQRAVSSLSPSETKQGHLSVIAPGSETLWSLTAVYDAALVRAGDDLLLISLGGRIVRTTLLHEDLATGVTNKRGVVLPTISTRLRWTPRRFLRSRIQGIDASVGIDLSGACILSIGIPVSLTAHSER